MNIFVLDTDPIKAAHMHCDQHLNKMILESAQMLSTWAYTAFPKTRSFIYKPSYENHPCTVWLKKSTDNRIWTILLANSLNNLRENQGYTRHSSMDIIDICEDCIGHKDFPDLYTPPQMWEFCGPLQYKLRPDLTIPQKYQLYYRQKYKQWLDTPRPMSYKNRPIPAFLADLPNIEGIK